DSPFGSGQEQRSLAMKIALIGATGFTGSPILVEALERGHAVTAIARNTDKLPNRPGVTARRADATDTASLATLVAGHDVVISAFNPGKDESGTGASSIIAAVKQAKVGRLLVVGGAGTLEVEPGKRLVDTPDFPAEWKDGALKTAAFLELLLAERDLDWAFLSPSALLVPGDRTGRYRVGGDRLLTDAKGESRISVEDLAVAMIDEMEQPRHHRRRFTVAY